VLAPAARPVTTGVARRERRLLVDNGTVERVETAGGADAVTVLRRAGMARGDLAGLAVAPDGSAAIATPGGGLVASADEVAQVDAAIRPRWATWSQETARLLIDRGVRLSTCWDIAAAHRLGHGGFRADPGYAWALLRGLPADGVSPPPRRASPAGPDLFDSAGGFDAGRATTLTQVHSGPADPIGPDGYLRPDWARGGWADSPDRLIAWARLALRMAELQQAALGGTGEISRTGGTSGTSGASGTAIGTARSESTAELLCAELAADGLPVDRTAAEGLLTEIIGPRPRGAVDAAANRTARDAKVLRHAPAGVTADLRSPAQVRSLLAAAGIEVPDTRAWRLAEFARDSPLVAALLEWRKAERILTTYGYAWLDEHLGPDGRLRGTWTGCDGAAGRMTASSGLHNMPTPLRKAVLAEPGHLFIRADLGQIEPRVLAAVSGDAALASATAADDMYLPVAAQLGVDRPTAKVAMIAAMYGQTSGHGGAAGRRMRTAYPVAMGYLDTAGRSAGAGRDLRTYGGRLIQMSGGGAGRSLYGRNALIQGAAAELFKMWAVTVRARAAALDARIVLCLHDELLVQVPEEHAARLADLVGDCLAETASRWAPGGRVRFLADISAVRCWADAKGEAGT
jgi:DNA polymerase I